MEFRVLGPVQVLAAGRPLGLGERKQRLILGLLLLEANRLVSVDRIVDLAWRERREGPPDSARRILQAHLSRLRTTLEAADPGRRNASLVRHGSCYTLSCDPTLIDAHQFRLLVERSRTADNDRSRVSLLRRANDLWRGPALADAATLQLRRELCDGLEEARLAAIEERLEVELRLGQHVSLIDELTDLHAKHPDRQKFTAQLMLALHRAGRTSEALRLYQDTRRWLSAELGLDPSAELTRLHVAILRDDRTLGLTPAESRPPAPAPETGFTAQLPRDVPDFTGRTAALTELGRLVVDGARPAAPGQDDGVTAPVAVISGCAGVGKTALAIRWASRVSRRFAGQLYVNLRGHVSGQPMTPMEALTVLLGGLGVDHEQIPWTVDAAAARYRSMLSGRRILVVLDDARSAEQVRPLLPGGPDSLVLVTSRHPLTGLVARDGARPVPLGALTPVEAHELLDHLLRGAGVAAQSAETAELARLCGHLPLAIRIAAANVASEHPYVSLAEYVRDMATGDRLEKLEIDDDRDYGVAAAFDRSYAALAPPARRLFRLMSVAGGAARDTGAIAALGGVGAGAARVLLGQLVNAYLVERRADGRYVIPDLPRSLATRRLLAEDPVDQQRLAVSRLLGWYLA